MQPKPGVVNIGPQLFHSPQVHHNPSSPSPPPPPPHSSHHHHSSSTTTPLEPLTMDPQLANTLEHIVGQLDILTQVRIVNLLQFKLSHFYAFFYWSFYRLCLLLSRD